MKQIKMLILLSFLFLLTPYALFATTWDIAGDGLSATTSPSPYDNYTNITTSLTISGATQLNVTVIGTIEDGYDFLYITDEAGNTRTFDGNINDTYTVTGSTVTLNFVSDYSITSTGLTVSIVDSTPPSIMDAFSVKYTTNLKGNIKTIGNTVLEFTGTIGTNANSHLNLSYVDIDGVASTFNSSSADIGTIEAGVDISSARVRWAGLYWQSYLHTWDPNDGGNSNNRYTSLNTLNSINNIIDTHSISFTTPSGAFPVRPSEIGKKQITNLPLNVDGSQWNAPGYNTISYSCFADVTNLLQGQAPNGTYTVANIPSQQGRTASVDSFSVGNTTWYDGLGNYGAWTLVVIYDNNATASEKTRNITVFDGYTEISGANNPSETIILSGFKTPSSTPNGVDSTISIFAAEGDRNILGDLATLTNQDGYTYILPDTSGAGSYFASVIEGVPIRNPLLVNNQGIDIHTTQVGTSGGADRPIKENQTSASVTLSTATTGTSRDTYYPSMVAFATELFTPELCYDYDVRIGDRIKIPSDNREIDTQKWDNTPLTITMLIRSELSDFPLKDSKLNVTFTPTSSASLDYISNASAVSPPDVNIYRDVNDIDTARGQIGIGRGSNTLLESTGGVIDALETTFAKQKFDFLGDGFSGTFDIQIEGTLQFDPNSLPVPFTLSTSVDPTSPNYIPRCNTNPVYDPIWSNFNIERTDSHDVGNLNVPSRQYPLYTQIAGQPFTVSLVSYTKDTSGDYTIPLDSNASVELELIDASTFDNNASAGYDSTCEEPGALGNGALFKNFAESGSISSRVDVDIPADIPGFNNDEALQSVAFRLWILSVRESNNTKRIINHSCTLDSTTPGCFQNLYRDVIKAYDGNATTTRECQTACESGASTDQGCYTCLRENFATPICSRDNFSIRPESFRIAISDSNESNTTPETFLTDNSQTNNTNLGLAAGYRYRIDVNATPFDPPNPAIPAKVRGYYNENFNPLRNVSNLGSKTDDNLIAAVEFQTSSGTCNDTTHSTADLTFKDGKTRDFTYISHNNVGDYSFYMLDSNWTNVDQASYPYKARFGICEDGRQSAVCTDCDSSNPSSSARNADGKLGCVINSNLEGNGAKDDNYIEMPLRFEPYKFSISSINMLLPNNNNFVYINNNLDSVICREMAVKFKGSISAQSKNDTNLSNYTVGCAAKDVLFDVNTSMTQNTIAVSNHNIPTAHGSSTSIYLRRSYVNSTNTSSTYDNNESNASSPVIILAEEFKNEDNGSTELTLYYNFRRYEDTPVNPINVLFISKEANSTLASSAAHLNPNYVPRARAAIGQNTDYLYGRITPDQPMYTVPRSQTSTVANLYVEVYCDYIGGCNPFGIPSILDPNEWRDNPRHTSPNDGQVDSIKDPKNQLTITPDANIDISTNPTPINISISSTPRTYATALDVIPTCQNAWFDDTKINTRFLGGGGWVGPGKTGLILDTNASHDDRNKRTEW